MQTGQNSAGLHHAYLLVGRHEEAEGFLMSLLAEHGVERANNPDIFTYKDSALGVDLARELASRSAQRAFASRQSSDQVSKKIFFISPDSMTLQGQNALLKTFEEPASGNHFFLVVREEGMAIPTLLSRMEVVHVSSRREASPLRPNEFLSLPLKDRILFAKKFADSEGNLADFLDDLLLCQRHGWGDERSMREVFNTRKFALDRSVAPRLIIEHLALVL